MTDKQAATKNGRVEIVFGERTITLIPDPNEASLRSALASAGALTADKRQVVVLVQLPLATIWVTEPLVLPKNVRLVGTKP